MSLQGGREALAWRGTAGEPLVLGLGYNTGPLTGAMAVLILSHRMGSCLEVCELHKGQPVSQDPAGANATRTQKEH